MTRIDFHFGPFGGFRRREWVLRGVDADSSLRFDARLFVFVLAFVLLLVLPRLDTSFLTFVAPV